MKNLAIGRKLQICFGVLIASFIMLAGISMICQGGLNDSVIEMGKSRRDKLIAIATINDATSDYRIAEATSILAVDPADIHNAEQSLANSSQLLANQFSYGKRAFTHPRAIAAFKEFLEKWQRYVVLSRNTMQLSHFNKNDEATASFRGSITAFNDANDAASRMQAVQVGIMDERMDAASASYALSRNMTIGVSLAVLALTVAMLISLTRGIATPIASMTATMRRLASGDLAVDVPVEERRDEVGALATSIVAFRDQLATAEQAKQEQTTLIVSSIGAGLSALSNGDLTARIEADLTGPFAELKTDFNDAMHALGETIMAVSGATGGIRTGSHEISQASDDLSRRTEQQAASLEETAAAMDEITATVRETASGAVRANQVVGTTRGDAEDGGRIVRQAVEAMGGIERSSNEISEIISVIDGIAFQTNLLALNAGVEAARAGDAGRGFAVVASEVRALAQRSAEAAKDVKTKITASAGQVEIGVALVGQTGQALERIVIRINEISQLVATIATSTEQQASGLQQVNTAVGEMDSVTQQNAAMVEEATAAARSLAGEAEALTEHVARFRLDLNERTRVPVVRQQAKMSPPTKLIVNRRGGGSSGSLALAQQPDSDDWSQF